MAINVTCPGCLTRFSVGDKFAGQKGPCPKCKEIITIPKPTDEVIIHAPEHSEAGAVGVGGRHTLKTFKRQDTKFKPLVFTAVAGAVLITLLAAIVLRGVADPSIRQIAIIVGAILLGPPIAWAGYTFLRDDELEAYQGRSLAIRALICGLVYALMWGVYWFIGTRWGGPDVFKKGLEIWQLAVLIGIPLGIGTFAAFASFDFEPGSAFFHVAMYFAITVVLRLVAGMPALPGLLVWLLNEKQVALPAPVTTLYDIPELAAWRRGSGLVRIPPGVDVPLTGRVRRLIDTAAFRRLAQISQLGLVSLVYPAANHTRQEHSLGVFLSAIEYVDRLAADERFAAAVSPQDAELLLASALLHDVGHWPFGHPIEDLHLPSVPQHEKLARRALMDHELSDLLHSDWQITSADVADLLASRGQDARRRILQSILSGPIDVDKIDYLMRDSLHAGVPYGQHFDRRRLIASLCLNEAGDGLAIMEKGKTAAEMMVFARYVMFSEVYWHHAVRAATAMLQRAFYLLHGTLDLKGLFAMSERPMIDALFKAAGDGPAHELVDGIFGPRRRLFKRLAQYGFLEEPALYERLARRPYPYLLETSGRIAEAIGAAIGQQVGPHDVLVDAPPTKLEVDFNVDVYFSKQRVYRPLGEVSPVVRTLAREQFDNYVKQVRIFVHPRIAQAARRSEKISERLAEAVAGGA